MSGERTAYLLEKAYVDGAVRDDVLVGIVGGRFDEVRVGATDGAAARATRLPGLSLPGLANVHSHAFHRALRGRTQRDRGSFWTWRELMYAVAERLDPDSYRDLATAVFREMVAAGITTVGEFHYLHHQPDGTPYDEPNAMGLSLVESARAAGLRITLLDTCYLSAGFGAAPEGVQRRFSDGDAERWAVRVDALRATLGPEVLPGRAEDLPGRAEVLPGRAEVVPGRRVGGAVHSVRAVPAEQLGTVAAATAGRPLHVHLSEQPAENDACRAAYGVTPTRLLHDHGCLGPTSTAVHATHLTDDDVALLGGTRTAACFCPTTERDLGDGIGPSRALHEAGSPLTLGSDSHAVVDPFEEMRAVELDERLASRRRGHWSATELLTAATAAGHAALGWPDAGRIAVGQRADLVTVDLDSPRTAGTGADLESAVFAATAEDVVQVVVDGRVVVRREDRPEIGRALALAIGRLWS